MRRPGVMEVMVSVFLLAGCGAAALHAEDHPRVIIAYGRDFTLHYLVGQYDPVSRQWLSNTSAAFKPPPALTPFTLFGPGGKLADVHILFKPLPYNPPWGWGADISRWPTEGHTRTLALSGTWASPPRVLRAVPLDDHDSVAAVTEYLRSQRLDVPVPRLTQNFRIDLNGDGLESQVICANVDAAVLVDSASAAVYSIVLLRHPVAGQPVNDVLRAATSFKPRGQTVDEHQRLHGAIGSYEVLAVTDIAGNGHEQIAILNTVSTGPEVDLFMLDNNHLQHVLSMAATYY